MEREKKDREMRKGAGSQVSPNIPVFLKKRREQMEQKKR